MWLAQFRFVFLCYCSCLFALRVGFASCCCGWYAVACAAHRAFVAHYNSPPASAPQPFCSLLTCVLCSAVRGAVRAARARVHVDEQQRRGRTYEGRCTRTWHSRSSSVRSRCALFVFVFWRVSLFLSKICVCPVQRVIGRLRRLHAIW